MTLETVKAPSEIDAIVGGYHGDAFRMLGPHAVERLTWEVRAFLPHASSVDVIWRGSAYPMARIHSQGFFTAQFPFEPVEYRLRVKTGAGGMVEIEDPYRFPPLLSDFDLYLHGEGTHYES